MNDYYIIHSRSLSDFAIARVELLEETGFKCYLPCRDLDDSGLPKDTYGHILNAISNSKKAKIFWDGVSHGCLVDLGICLGMSVIIDEIVIVRKGTIASLIGQMEAELRHQ